MSESGGQRYTTANKLAATKDKMKVHQRMIDLTAIQLESTRKAMTSDQDDRAVFDENVQLVEVSQQKVTGICVCVNLQYCLYEFR